jgi:carbon monoxide dehydrogenase subunit G
VAFKIEERFEVNAPVERVWRYLVDPRQVVECLPGAELTGQEDDHTFLGRVTVKVGPVTASYNGRAQLGAVDDATRTVQLTAEGKEKGGAGSAKLRMSSRVSALPNGASEVTVDAEVDVAGKIVQFGRGMIESVSKQLFRQFADCVRSTLAHPPADLDVTPSSSPSTRAPEADALMVRAPSLNDTLMSFPAMKRPTAPLADRPVQLADRAVPADLPMRSELAPGRPIAAPTAVRTATPAPRVKPVNAVPLFFRAIWEVLRGAVLRVFRRR